MEGIPEPPGRRDMNLNDFVVLPNNKAKSVKLNARNLQDLQMETLTLASESKDLEEKLQQLKYSMSKEKEERGHSGGFKWMAGRCGSLNNNPPPNNSKTNKENKLQKLSAGKMKIRVLKDELLTAPPQPPPPPPPPTTGLRMTRKSRLKGTICGQCEVKTAGVMCAECTENYCISCFARFHQKGALKLHRMTPIQADLQTHVSTRDVVTVFQKQINPSSCPATLTSSSTNPNHTITSNAITRRGDESGEKESGAEEKHMKLHPESSQVLVVSHGEDAFPAPLLRGEYDEEESARCFQEALRQWRGEMGDGGGEPMTADSMWKPLRSVSAMATQADLPPDRGAEGRRGGGGGGGGEERVPVKVEFTGNSLTYMDRLLLKKHRRTPIESYHPSLAIGRDLKSPPITNIEEETAGNLTAGEEDFRRYCASLFAVPVSRGRTEPQITTPESCLVIEVLDETCSDIKRVFAAEQGTDNSREVPSVQQSSRKGGTLVFPSAPSSDDSSSVSHSPPPPTQPSRQSRAPAQPKTAKKLDSIKPQTSQAEHPVKSLPFKSKTSTYSTAETSRTSKASIKTPTSKSPRSICSPATHKSKANCGSPQFLSSLPHSQSEIPKLSHSPLLFSTDALALVSNRPAVSEDRPPSSPSISLRSTFTVSPSSSNESALLPKVYYSAPIQKASDSSLSPEQPQSTQLFAEPISSPKLCESPRGNLMSPQQSQHSLCDPVSLLPDNKLQVPFSPQSASPPLRSLESQISPVPHRLPANTLSRLSVYNEPLTDTDSTYIPDDPKSTLPHQDTHCIPSSHLLNVIKNCPFAVRKEEEEEELSMDSGDEMSSDSLGLAPYEEDSSGDEAQIQGELMRERSREEQQSPAISHLEDSFVPAEAETEKDLETVKPEQLSEPSMVTRNQSAGSGSEHFCDLDGYSPLGLDMNTGHSDTPHAHCDPLHASRSPLHDPDPTGSESNGPSSDLRTYTEEHLVSRVMKDDHTQPTGIQIHSTSRRETAANELGTSGSGSNLTGKFTPILAPRTNPGPLSAPASPLSHPACLVRPTLGSELGPAFHLLSRAAQEIMEICSVDQTGCEDPDLDADTTAHTLHGLERELRLMAKETGTRALDLAKGNSGSQDQHHLKRATVSEEQKEAEEAAESVLLLP